MKIIHGARQTGKTTKLIEDFIADTSEYKILVTATKAESVYIHQTYGIPFIYLRSLQEMREGTTRGLSSPKVYIDNLEWVLMNIMGYQVNEVTMGGPVEFDKLEPYDVDGLGE